MIPFINCNPSDDDIARLSFYMARIRTTKNKYGDLYVTGDQWEDVLCDFYKSSTFMSLKGKEPFDVAGNDSLMEAKIRGHIPTDRLLVELSNGTGNSSIWGYMRKEFTRNMFCNKENPQEFGDEFLRANFLKKQIYMREYEELHKTKINTDKCMFIICHYWIDETEQVHQVYSYHISKFPTVGLLSWAYRGKALRGYVGNTEIICWYGADNGQAKWYPLVSDANYCSNKFTLPEIKQLVVQELMMLEQHVKCNNNEAVEHSKRRILECIN